MQEGTIVRAITRLNETCREVRDAARVIGDTDLFNKMEQCQNLLKVRCLPVLMLPISCLTDGVFAERHYFCGLTILVEGHRANESIKKERLIVVKGLAG